MKITDESIESLMKQLEALEPGRQHGKKGTVLADSEAEKRRLYNNLASRLSRAKKKKLLQMPHTIPELTQNKQSEFTDKDIRRYKSCFVYEHIKPEKKYVRSMTGLTDFQIEKLEKLTGLKTANY